MDASVAGPIGRESTSCTSCVGVDTSEELSFAIVATLTYEVWLTLSMRTSTVTMRLAPGMSEGRSVHVTSCPTALPPSDDDTKLRPGGSRSCTV